MLKADSRKPYVELVKRLIISICNSEQDSYLSTLLIDKLKEIKSNLHKYKVSAYLKSLLFNPENYDDNVYRLQMLITQLAMPETAASNHNTLQKLIEFFVEHAERDTIPNFVAPRILCDLMSEFSGIDAVSAAQYLIGMQETSLVQIIQEAWQQCESQNVINTALQISSKAQLQATLTDNSVAKNVQLKQETACASAASAASADSEHGEQEYSTDTMAKANHSTYPSLLQAVMGFHSPGMLFGWNFRDTSNFSLALYGQTDDANSDTKFDHSEDGTDSDTKFDHSEDGMDSDAKFNRSADGTDSDAKFDHSEGGTDSDARFDRAGADINRYAKFDQSNENTNSDAKFYRSNENMKRYSRFCQSDEGANNDARFDRSDEDADNDVRFYLFSAYTNSNAKSDHSDDDTNSDARTYQSDEDINSEARYGFT